MRGKEKVAYVYNFATSAQLSEEKCTLISRNTLNVKCCKTLLTLMTSEQYRNENRKSSRNDERMSQPLMRQ